MGESLGPPISHDVVISPEMAGILRHNQEVTINSAFAGNFSFNRSLRGELPQKVNVDTGHGGHDYDSKGFNKFRLAGESTGLVDIVQRRGFGSRGELHPALAGDTQLLIIDTLQQPSKQYEEENNLGNKSRDYAVVSYAFEQSALQPVGAGAGRPLGSIGVRSLLPQAQTDELVRLLQRDPDAIEDYYHGVAGGIEDVAHQSDTRYTKKGEKIVQRVKSDRLTMIDLRGISDQDRRAILEGQYSAAAPVAELLEALDLQGKIQRLNYRKSNHGIVDPQAAKIQIPQIADPDRVPRIDAQAGKRKYDEVIQRFKGDSQGGQSKGGLFGRFRRG